MDWKYLMHEQGETLILGCFPAIRFRSAPKFPEFKKYLENAEEKYLMWRIIGTRYGFEKVWILDGKSMNLTLIKDFWYKRINQHFQLYSSCLKNTSFQKIFIHYKFTIVFQVDYFPTKNIYSMQYCLKFYLRRKVNKLYPIHYCIENRMKMMSLRWITVILNINFLYLQDLATLSTLPLC